MSAGRVLMMLGKAQFELQKFVDTYRSNIIHTITTPSESLLKELQTVEVWSIKFALILCTGFLFQFANLDAYPQKIVNHKFNFVKHSVNKEKTLQLSNPKFPYQNMPLIYINVCVWSWYWHAVYLVFVHNNAGNEVPMRHEKVQLHLKWIPPHLILW